MLLFSTILPINDTLTKDGFIQLAIDWNQRCEFQSNGAPVPEERCAHSNANGVAVPFQTA